MTNVELETNGAGKSARFRNGLLILSVWISVAMLSAMQFYVAALSTGAEVDWGGILSLQLPLWGSWILLTPFVLFTARRFPLERGHLTRSVPVHLLAATACGLLYIGLWMYWSLRIAGYSYGETSLAETFWNFFRARFNVAFLTYWAIIGVYYAFTNHRRYRERNVEIARAREELARAQLTALRLQLQPHFLFNTLHAVSSLMEDDVRTARAVLARLSELLRATLEHDGAEELSLDAELELLNGYLEIEHTRFGDRLRVELDVADEARRALVPAFLLQPLVENAIRHGITPRESAGSVKVRATRANGQLRLSVSDDGAGIPDVAGVANGRGIGLRNTRERLRRLYGNDHTFELRCPEGHGCSVDIAIPFRTAPETGT